MRLVIAFYIAGLLGLVGFLFAGVTNGSTASVSLGFAGLLGCLVSGAARISLEDQPVTVRRTVGGPG